MSRRKVAELDTPFSSVEWPAISQEDQDTILELLCALLAPLGEHRRNHVVPSRGKRSRRRQRHVKDAEAEASMASETPGAPESSATVGDAPARHTDVPPPPELARFVDAGLARITRQLADYAPGPAKTKSPGSDAKALPSSSSSVDAAPLPSPYTAVFVVRSAHPSAFYSHFPQMVAVASAGSMQSADPNSARPHSPIRLVGFSRACEAQLSASLGIPRVSSIALRAGAPQSQGLLDFLRDKVPPVKVPWLDEARAGQFRPTQIHMADVPVGPKKKKKKG